MIRFNSPLTIVLLALGSSFAALTGLALLPPAVDRAAASSPQPLASAKAYPRRPIALTDQAKPGSSFYEFRQRLRQAVRDRDPAFLRQIADPQIRLTFGRPLTLEQLEIANPNAIVWQHLERIVNTGCAPARASADVLPKFEAWTCPHVAETSGNPFLDVYIVGTGVNVRSQPATSSSVVAVLSNEIVQSDPKGNLSPQQWQRTETSTGWRPVITPEGVRGFVSSRYAYIAAGYRAQFEHQQGQWKMTSLVAGD